MYWCEQRLSTHPEIDLTLVVEGFTLMYGNGTGPATRETRGDAVQSTVERVSDINNGTINMLESCRRSLDHMIGKVYGPRPEEEKTPAPNAPSLMGDARRMNELANQLHSRLEELHQAIGHDKQ